VIDLHEISKVFGEGDGVIVALHGVNLHVERGEFLGVLGPSGSGKSSLLNIVGLLDTPTRGTYDLEGMNVLALSDRHQSELRNRMFGFVFQSFNLLPRYTALENVEVPLRYSRRCPRSRRRDRAAECLDRVGLSPRAHHTPTELSGGQQQRVAVARALVAEPEIILADEPTGNLDSESARSIMDLLRELNQQGLTVVVITHSNDYQDYFTRSIRLRDGRLEESVFDVLAR